MGWIVQGNPKVFNVNEYLACYPMLVYWQATRYRLDIALDDRVFIWRAGPISGVIASGKVIETPVAGSSVAHPEALGDDLWFGPPASSNEPKVGIALDSIRLSPAEGMLLRAIVKDDVLLQHSDIIKMPNATIFRLDQAELRRIEALWNKGREIESAESELSALEGQLQLRAHRLRERSRFLVTKKFEAFRLLHGSLHCEICAFSEVDKYPTALAASVFEVHHVSPLSEATSPRRTILADLAVVCANCHRAIHASADAPKNMETIKRLLAN